MSATSSLRTVSPPKPESKTPMVGLDGGEFIVAIHHNGTGCDAVLRAAKRLNRISRDAASETSEIHEEVIQAWDEKSLTGPVPDCYVRYRCSPLIHTCRAVRRWSKD